MTTYHDNGPWGAGKNSKLTPLEVDTNFWEILQRLGAIEQTPTDAPITDITVTGGVMTITVAGGEQFQVTLPVAMFVPRGDWAHPNHYVFMDVVNVTGQGGYMVTQDHDTETPFDPDRVIGGLPVYQKIFNPGAAGAAGAPGIDGEDGAAGPPGPTGYFKIDVEAAFSTRDAYDSSEPGFVFISNNGADGLGGLPVMYIMGEGSAGNWTGPYMWGSPQGPVGPAGPEGPRGANADWDATGTYAERSAHNAAAAGFTYLSTDGDGGATTFLASLFIRETATAGVWSDPIEFAGPPGPIGPPGPQGPAGPTGLPGANADWDATGTFAQRASYDSQAKDFVYLSQNGDGATSLDASLYIKQSATLADWGARIPFQGPKGNTGPPGPAGAAGMAGPAGVGVPTGGSTGQVLKKTTNANYATAWQDEGAGGGPATEPVHPLMMALSDETTNLTAGTAKITLRMPFKGQIVGLPRASLNNASTSGLPTIDINKNGTSVLSTLLTIDATERTSVSAATPCVVATPAFNDNDEFTFDLDVAGTAAKGLKLTMYIQKVA